MSEGSGTYPIRPDRALLVQLQDLLLNHYAQHVERAVRIHLKPSVLMKLANELWLASLGPKNPKRLDKISDMTTGKMATLYGDPTLERGQVRVEWRRVKVPA